MTLFAEHEQRPGAESLALGPGRRGWDFGAGLGAVVVYADRVTEDKFVADQTPDVGVESRSENSGFVHCKCL